MKKRYLVTVSEIYRRTMAVEAESESEAHQRVSDAWKNAEFILTGEDLEGAEFYVVGEADGTELYEEVERKP